MISVRRFLTLACIIWLFGGNSPPHTQMLFLDGSVRSLPPDIDPKVLRALSTPSGGEKLPEDY